MSKMPTNPATTSPSSGSEPAATEPDSASPVEQIPAEDDQDVESPETDASDDGAEPPAEFDRAAVEARYGLPAGALNDFEDEASALAAIRQGIDQSLMQSLYSPAETPSPEIPNTQPSDTQQKAQEVAAGSLEALQKKVAELESALQSQTQAQQQQAAREVTEQASKVIDGWDSARYGTSKTRTFKQTQNLRELLGMVRTHTETLRAAGHPVPPVGTVLERIRLWHDDDYTPAHAKAAPAVPVGTPGGHKEANDSDAPTNIHSAVMAAWRKAT